MEHAFSSPSCRGLLRRQSFAVPLEIPEVRFRLDTALLTPGVRIQQLDLTVQKGHREFVSIGAERDADGCKEKECGNQKTCDNSARSVRLDSPSLWKRKSSLEFRESKTSQSRTLRSQEADARTAELGANSRPETGPS